MTDPSKNTRPPEDEEGWEYLWDGAQKAKAAWMVVGPIYAVVSNWKALLAAAAFWVWINRPEIASALTTLFGGQK